MRAIALLGGGLLLGSMVVSAQAQGPGGPNFHGTLHVQSDLEHGPTVIVENKNAGGDVAIDFLAGGELVGNIAWGDGHFFILQNNPLGANLTLIEEGGGNVGIGTPNPQSALHVQSNSASGPTVIVENSNADAAIDFLAGGELVGNLGWTAGHFFVLQNNPFGANLTLIEEGGGNVGIGTTDPQSALQVIGYTQLDLTSGTPPAGDCDETAERGRMVVDSGAGLLYICVASGWVAK